MQIRPVVVPSLSGGWLELNHVNADPPAITRVFTHDAAELFGRYPVEGDFCGLASLHLAGGVLGVPVLWDREAQLGLVYFFDTIDRITGGFPRGHSFESADGVMRIDSVVDFKPDQPNAERHVANLAIRLRSPLLADELTGALLVPTGTCRTVTWSLVDFFPSVTAQDIDSA